MTPWARWRRGRIAQRDDEAREQPDWTSDELHGIRQVLKSVRRHRKKLARRRPRRT